MADRIEGQPVRVCVDTTKRELIIESRCGDGAGDWVCIFLSPEAAMVVASGLAQGALLLTSKGGADAAATY